MTPNKLEYSLNEGFIDNWLVLGPVTSPVADFSSQDGKSLTRKEAYLREAYEPSITYTGEVVDLGEAAVGSVNATWHYQSCSADHLMDVSADYLDWRIARTYLYADIEVRIPSQADFEVFSNGLVTIWLNGNEVLRQDQLSDEGRTVTFQCYLEKANQMVVRFEQLGSIACKNFLALRMLERLESTILQEIQIKLPTNNRYPRRHQILEKGLEKAHMEEVVNYHGASFNLHWSDEAREELQVFYQVQDENEMIYVEGTIGADPEAVFDIGHTVRLFERAYRIVLKAPAREYYNSNNRYQRSIPLYVLDTKYASEPVGTFAERRAEALKDASKRDGLLFAQIAKMARDKWGDVNTGTLNAAIEKVNCREAGSDVLLLGLIGSLIRYPEQVEIQNLKEAVHSTVHNYKFDPNQPGGDALDFDSEAHHLILETCKVLIGQLWDEFAGMRAGAETELASWIRSRGTSGFSAWLSNSDMELVVAGLATLTSLASDETVRELSAVLLDKVLFDLAVHTFHGAFGSAHAISEVGMLKSAQLEGTSGISRMVYGMGVYNPNIVGVVSLAIADYEFPSFFAEIANDSREEMLSKENQRGVTTVTYRTPDTMLSSVQDYKAGEKGQSEHIWQATLGPDSVIFGTHPANYSESGARRPGYWLGNGVLPRVAQWKDVLVSVHNFSEGNGLGFTHAYFPVYKFDEYAIKDGWLLARKGNGYVALTAARGLELVKNGQGGYQELRSFGSPNIWICQMGRAAQDGSYENFQTKVKAIRLEWPGNSAKFSSLRGEQIQFGWEGPLLVNGTEQALSSSKHIDNPYCQAEEGKAGGFEIGKGDILMRLNFD